LRTRALCPPRTDHLLPRRARSGVRSLPASSVDTARSGDPGAGIGGTADRQSAFPGCTSGLRAPGQVVPGEAFFEAVVGRGTVAGFGPASAGDGHVGALDRRPDASGRPGALAACPGEPGLSGRWGV